MLAMIIESRARLVGPSIAAFDEGSLVLLNTVRLYSKKHQKVKSDGPLETPQRPANPLAVSRYGRELLGNL